MGKSSIINRLIGENRVIVSDIAGTTRDAIDTEVVLSLIHISRYLKVVWGVGYKIEKQ